MGHTERNRKPSGCWDFWAPAASNHCGPGRAAGCHRGLLGAAVGAGARGQGDLTGVTQEGQEKPAFLGDIAARRKDSDF